MKNAISVVILLAFQSFAHAGITSYEGSFELDNTTSIEGTVKHDRFDFRLTLDGSSVDLEHSFDVKLDGAIEFFGRYTGAVIGFQMTRDSSNAGTWNPSDLTYDLLGSSLLTWDVNPPASSDPLDFMNEHLTVSVGVVTADSPLHRINLNLYNSTFYPPDATRQLWLDASSPSNGFTLDDLFLHGMDTLPEFRSIKPWEGKSLVDSVFLDGGAGSPNFGTWGSGTVQSLTVVPEPTTLVTLTVLGMLCLGCRRRGRIAA
jgi:hypothetical protein